MYTTLGALKAYLGIGGGADDALLEAMVERASATVDALCNRTFRADADSTRTFDVLLDVGGRTLWLDRDLCAVTSVVNGDGQPIDSGDLLLLPRGGPPFAQIGLARDSDVYWQGDGEIVVTGRWAYSVTPPDTIVQATERLAAWFYRQKDVGYEPARPTFAGITYTSDLPADVRALIAPFRRVAL